MEQQLDARVRGDAVPTTRLAKAAAGGLADSDLGGVQALLDRLAAARIIARAADGWRLARDPAEVRLADITSALGLGYAGLDGLASLEADWRGTLAASLAGADDAAQALPALPVEALLAARRAGAPPPAVEAASREVPKA